MEGTAARWAQPPQKVRRLGVLVAVDDVQPLAGCLGVQLAHGRLTGTRLAHQQDRLVVRHAGRGKRVEAYCARDPNCALLASALEHGRRPRRRGRRRRRRRLRVRAAVVARAGHRRRGRRRGCAVLRMHPRIEHARLNIHTREKSVKHLPHDRLLGRLTKPFAKEHVTTFGELLVGGRFPLGPPEEIAWRDEAVLAQEDARGGATPLQLHHHVDHLAAE